MKKKREKGKLLYFTNIEGETINEHLLKIAIEILAEKRYDLALKE